jgi:hypothetical protein
MDHVTSASMSNKRLVTNGTSRNRKGAVDTLESEEVNTTKLLTRKATLVDKRIARDNSLERKKILTSAQLLDKVEMKVFEDVKNTKNSSN